MVPSVDHKKILHEEASRQVRSIRNLSPATFTARHKSRRAMNTLDWRDLMTYSTDSRSTGPGLYHNTCWAPAQRNKQPDNVEQAPAQQANGFRPNKRTGHRQSPSHAQGTTQTCKKTTDHIERHS
jgi:hypothetical protein